MLPKICILSFSNIAWDSRVLREIEFARHHYRVDVIGFGEWNPFEGVRYFPIVKTPRDKPYLARYLLALAAGRVSTSAYERFFWGKAEYRAALEIMLREKYDLIHANDWDAVPVAVTAARRTGARVLFDAHEYTVEQEADRPFWKTTVAPFRDYLLRAYQDPVNARITVSDGVQQLYRENYGWDMDLVLNAQKYVPVPFRSVDPDRILLVHHGGAIPSRYIEDYIDLAAALRPHFSLHFVLIPTNPGYFAGLKERAALVAPGRITFHDPVPPEMMVETISRFDLGIPLMRVRQLSYYYALPNKLFDYVVSGLAVAVSPLPSMQRIIEQAGNGVVSVDQTWQSMAACINQLTPEQINKYKQRSLLLAQQINADTEGRKLLEIYAKILG